MSIGDRRLRYLVAEARCYWCGTLAGTLEAAWPLQPGGLMFRRCGEHQALVPAKPNCLTLRCRRCGGPLFVDQFEVLTLRPKKSDESEDRPRRGRPRKQPL